MFSLCPAMLMRTFPAQNPQRFFAPKKTHRGPKETDSRFDLAKVEDKSIDSVGELAAIPPPLLHLD